MLRDVVLLFIREHDGSSHFIPFPKHGVSFKNTKRDLVLMTIPDRQDKYVLRESDAYQIQKTLANHTENSSSINLYPADFNKTLLDRIFNHDFSTLNLVAKQRLRNILLKHNIYFIGDLVQYTEDLLLEMRGIGEIGVEAIKAMLREKELELGVKVAEWERYRPIF